MFRRKTSTMATTACLVIGMACAAASTSGEESKALSLRGTPRQLPGGWFSLAGNTQNFADLGGERFSMTVMPGQEAVTLNSNEMYSGGRVELKAKSASVMPGIITAIYLASGDGRKGENTLGSQDELDFEFKGNDAQRVQTNVFMNGYEDLQMIDLGGDGCAAERTYAMEWDQSKASFYIDGNCVRTTPLSRPLKPMRFSISVWTTTNGWDGLKKWGGDTNWAARGDEPATGTFEILSLPGQERTHEAASDGWTGDHQQQPTAEDAGEGTAFQGGDE